MAPAQAHPQPALTAAEEADLVARLRAGDERAFEALVDRHYAMMLAVARGYVRTRAVAEEVVQEAWLGVLNGIDRFEGRSSLKTWIFRIVANRAKTRGQREARSRPFSSLEAEPAVDPDRFVGGEWATPPASWPEERLLGNESLRVIGDAIEGLPPSQRAVITLRDVQGWSAEEVRNALELSETNERVLLHRARAKVRAALEAYLMEDV